jgi:DNA-binding GntR family transcriptional regulator
MRGSLHVNEKLSNLDVDTERFKRKPLRIEVYDFLKTSIIQGKLKPGEKLNEIDLGQHLGISRTPIRETLLRLENEGFVTIDPGRGAIVAKHSREDLEEIYPLVAVLEGLAAALATPHLSRSDLAKMKKYNKQMKETSQASQYMELNTLFHQTFLENCHNDRLLGALLNFKDQIFRFRVFSLSMPNRLAESVAEHDSIIQAFEQKDAKLAEELVREHVKMGKIAIEKSSLDYY